MNKDRKRVQANIQPPKKSNANPTSSTPATTKRLKTADIT